VAKRQLQLGANFSVGAKIRLKNSLCFLSGFEPMISDPVADGMPLSHASRALKLYLKIIRRSHSKCKRVFFCSAAKIK
jgi:hypothetical protein